MANITSVDYEAIPSQAKQMRAEAQQLNSEMTKAYTSIENMHNSWYGVRYNELQKAFNNLIPSLNEMLTLVVKEIPFALETVANNYSLADKGTKVTSAINDGPKPITALTITSDVGMKFITADVEATQKSVETNFENSKEQMNKIESIYNGIDWKSEAATAFKAQFTKLKNEIVNSFENLKADFAKLMNETKSDIQATESANTVE